MQGHEIGALEVHFDNSVPDLFRVRRRREAPRGDAGAVNENVQCAVGIDCLLYNAQRLTGVRNVARDGDGLPSPLDDGNRSLVRALNVNIRRDHARSMLCE